MLSEQLAEQDVDFISVDRWSSWAPYESYVCVRLAKCGEHRENSTEHEWAGRLSEAPGNLMGVYIITVLVIISH